jgi:arginyl-tRNA synthetase
MKEKVASLLSKHIKLSKNAILEAIEIPKDPALGDYAFPCFALAKELKKNPAEIAKDLVKKINASNDFEKIQPQGPYINFFVNRLSLAQDVISEIQKGRDTYGHSKKHKGKTLVIEMSSPNIAKPFGIGHLRSTIIGSALANIGKSQGYKTIKINYLGDWGTQFGILIAGYKKFGSEKALKKDPISHLLEIYVKANKNGLEGEGKEWFKKLEQGDKTALQLWKKFRSLSSAEFSKIYETLNIKFDVISGESLFAKKAPEILSLLRKKNLLVESEGALIIDLEKYKLGVCIIQKSDGTTLYATRDIATALDRYKKFSFDKMIYEVGSEQKLYFKQLFKILELLGNSWAKSCIHVDHGLYLDKDGKKLATREGKTVFMASILEETQALAEKEIAKREKLSTSELEKRALKIALAAIFYGDLKNYRSNDIIFDIEKFLSFEGDTGPYLLYTYARAQSILRKANYKEKAKPKITELGDKEKHILSQLSNFSNIIDNSLTSLAPNIIANYSFQLAQKFNEFYHSEKVIGSEDEEFKLSLVSASAQVLKNALSLLGISVLEKM